MARMMIFLFAVLGAVLATGCEPPAQLRVEGAVVQLSPVDGRPSVAYFKIIGGPESTTLLDVNSPHVLRMEIHETVNEDGMAMMKQIRSVPVPAKGTVAFEPGGKHVMIWGVSESAKKQGMLPMQFVFSNDDRIEVQAVIRSMGGTEPDEQAEMESHDEPIDEKPEG